MLESPATPINEDKPHVHRWGSLKSAQSTAVSWGRLLTVLKPLKIHVFHTGGLLIYQALPTDVPWMKAFLAREKAGGADLVRDGFCISSTMLPKGRSWASLQFLYRIVTSFLSKLQPNTHVNCTSLYDTIAPGAQPPPQS